MGKIVNEFKMPDQHRVQFGLSGEDGELAYFAKNLTTGLPIPATVEERTIPGTAFRIQYNGYRALRFGGNPRSISRPILEDLLALFRGSESMLFFSNALHAGASVNHIHLQSVFHGERLAIEEAQTSSSKVPSVHLLYGYGANGLVFDRDVATEVLFAAVDRLQLSDIPFNLILAGDRIFLLSRDADQEVVLEFAGGGASMELAGKMITNDRSVFEGISSQSIAAVLGKATLPVRQEIPEHASNAG